MSKVAMTALSMEECLLDLPYEIMFDIFRRLPKGKLAEISKMCSKFRNVAEDTRLWKHVVIRYESYDRTEDGTIFAFEELYSGPWTVKEIELEGTRIEPPVSWKTDQVVKVTRLDLSRIAADKVTLEAILAKYQCTEICFNSNSVDRQGRIEGIAPETFSKQTALEKMILRVNLKYSHYDPLGLLRGPQNMIQLSNCKNLKDLYFCPLFNTFDWSGFAKNLPSSLEKLFLEIYCLEDAIFKSLAESAPNLKQLALMCPASVKCPFLLKFQFLESLNLYPCRHHDVSNLDMYLIKFPALKTVVIGRSIYRNAKINHVELAETLTPQGIIVRPEDWVTDWPYPRYLPEDCNVWKVSKKAI